MLFVVLNVDSGVTCTVQAVDRQPDRVLQDGR